MTMNPTSLAAIRELTHERVAALRKMHSEHVAYLVENQWSDAHVSAQMELVALCDHWLATRELSAQLSALQGRVEACLPDVDELAQIIRCVDGNHSLGAGALAEAIIAALKEQPK